MRHLDLPSAETIAALSRRKPQCPIELKRVEREKQKQTPHRSRDQLPPDESGLTLIDGRGRGSKPLVAKSKPFGGVLLAYRIAGDHTGYKREYSRLWRLARKANDK